MAGASILLVSADAEAIAIMHGLGLDLGADLQVVGTTDALPAEIARNRPDAVLVQVDACCGNSAAGLARAASVSQGLPIVAFGRPASIPLAVAAARAGALAYIDGFPPDGERMRELLCLALSGRGCPATPSAFERPLGKVVTGSHAMARACAVLAQVALTDVPVWLEAEPGAGKTFLAACAHRCSPRRTGPMLHVDCGAMQRTALVADLSRQEFWNRVAGGTLLLRARDPLGAEVEGVLGASPHRRAVAARLLFESDGTAAGNGQAVISPALCRRLNIVKVCIPPLRERVTDIPTLVTCFLEQESVRRGQVLKGLSDGALSALVRYGWPGNVEELRRVVQRAVEASRGAQVSRACLPPAVVGWTRGDTAGFPDPVGVADLKEALREPERRYILRALQASHWNKKDAAERLRISRSTLYKKMKEHGLDRQAPAMLSAIATPQPIAWPMDGGR